MTSSPRAPQPWLLILMLLVGLSFSYGCGANTVGEEIGIEPQLGDGPSQPVPQQQQQQQVP